MKVYIAAPFFNDRQLDIVKGIEKSLTELNIDFFSPRSYGKSLKDMGVDELATSKKEVFMDNINNMDECTRMIACVEQSDTGTSFEIGYYYCAGKPVVLFSEKIEQINVMLAEAAISVCDRRDKLLPALIGEYTVELSNLI